MKKGLVVALLLAAVSLLYLVPSPLPRGIGTIDFRAYWSAGYLFVHGENFANAARLFQVEREQTGWTESYPMVTWNPPWLLTLIAPYTLIPFPRAVWLWLWSNLALVFVSAVSLWMLYATGDAARRKGWIAPLVAFAYSPTLVSLIAGQVNLLVLAGISGFLVFRARRHDASAGAALALTLVKPHLVYVTAPLLLLDAARNRHWRVLVGFVGALAALTAIVFLVRPSFVFEYGATVGAGSLLSYETPTAGGFLTATYGWSGFKWLSLLVLPLAAMIWWRRRDDVNTLLMWTLFVSIITAPFGWSYDFVLLVVPLISVSVSIFEGSLPRAKAGAILALLLVVDLLSLYERVLSPSELYYFWLPLAVAGVFVFAHARRKQKLSFVIAR